MYNALYGKGKCLDGLAHCKATGDNSICSKADNYCAINVEEVLDIVANRDEYDIRELSPDPFPYNFYFAYLNMPKVQKALGAFTNYSDYSATVGDAFGTTGDDGREVMTIEDVRKLLKQGIYVVSYAGDAGMLGLIPLFSSSNIPRRLQLQLARQPSRRRSRRRARICVRRVRQHHDLRPHRARAGQAGR